MHLRNHFYRGLMLAPLPCSLMKQLWYFRQVIILKIFIIIYIINLGIGILDEIFSPLLLFKRFLLVCPGPWSCHVRLSKLSSLMRNENVVALSVAVWKRERSIMRIKGCNLKQVERTARCDSFNVLYGKVLEHRSIPATDPSAPPKQSFQSIV